MQGLQQTGGSVAARGRSGMEEVIPLGEEVLEVSKRTENRGTARIRRYVVETPVEEQVTLQSERVVVERRRPVSDKVTGEILTEVTVEVVETAEVPVIEKRTRLREEIVVRTERTQHVETVRETVRRDEVEIQQPGRKRRRSAASLCYCRALILPVTWKRQAPVWLNWCLPRCSPPGRTPRLRQESRQAPGVDFRAPAAIGPRRRAPWCRPHLRA